MKLTRVRHSLFIGVIVLLLCGIGQSTVSAEAAPWARIVRIEASDGMMPHAVVTIEGQGKIWAGCTAIAPFDELDLEAQEVVLQKGKETTIVFSWITLSAMMTRNPSAYMNGEIRVVFALWEEKLSLFYYGLKYGRSSDEYKRGVELNKSYLMHGLIDKWITDYPDYYRIIY